MLFNSIDFLVFFPTVTILYFLLPHKARWFLLLAASCFFYMAFVPKYILILALTIVVDYFAGIYIEKSVGKRRKMFLIISIISTCLILFIFKYFNFFNTNIEALAHVLHWNYPIGSLKLILPIGLSFHTFQSMAYIIEVYRGNQKAEKHFGIYSLYVMFYPQLVAGPIERPQNLLHQFREYHKFNPSMVTSGLRLMFWGFIKKVVIADRLALYCNEVYSNNSYHGWPVLLAIIFFAFQIYCDFSGYSDIAIGAARVMGFRLMQNFNQPYLSASISEFWKRWHISLSTWFRDYLYISLGGNRVNITRLYFNLFITFLVSGLWHGANWTFIIWGALNGLYIILELSLKPFGARLPGVFRSRPVNILITFTLINFSWVFFRSKSVAEAVHVIGSVFPLGNIRSMAIEHFNIKDILFALASIVALEIVTFINGKHNLGDFLANQKKWIQWTVYYGGLALVFLFGVYNNTQFIYFQF